MKTCYIESHYAKELGQTIRLVNIELLNYNYGLSFGGFLAEVFSGSIQNISPPPPIHDVCLYESLFVKLPLRYNQYLN